MKAIFGSAALVAACTILFAGAALAQDTPKGDVAHGKALFDTVGCFGCHGYAGQGGAAGPKLVEPLAWPAFILQVRTPRQLMPAYVDHVLSDQQVADIYAYVETLPKPVDPKTTPLLH